MAAGTSPKKAAIRSLIALLVITLGLVGLVAGFVKSNQGQAVPKLGLDLEGGTEVILKPVITGSSSVSPEQINQAVDIIRQRIDANGVAEAEISTLGGTNISVAIPGKPTKEQLDALRKPSQLRFRAVLATAPDASAATPQSTATPSGAPTTSGAPTSGTPASSAPATTPGATPSTGALGRPAMGPGRALAPAAETPTPTTPGTPASQAPATTAPATSAPATPPAPTPAPADPTKAPPGLATQVSAGLVELGWDKKKADAAGAKAVKDWEALNCSQPGAFDRLVDDSKQPLVTCSEEAGQAREKFVLAPAEVEGSDISDASSGFQTGPNGQPTNTVEVSLKFNGEGTQKFSKVTTRLFANKAKGDDATRFAIVLDKVVISAPTTNAAITNGQASITGNFTVDSAKALAQQLKFGALPMSFSPQTESSITPQLGQEQLRIGLLAGLVGLLLVVVYSLIQYRALGMVTVMSLLVAAVLTYLAVVILGTTHGLRLTMAGVTGLIVAIGVTADSFIVYFERIRDEVREGRPLAAAVETGWKRARRTILAADAVNLIAAVVLYVLATSNVRGFAFTLGLTTLIDVAVVMLFTHPMVQLLTRTKFFAGGHKWSGLDPERLGAKVARYRGRGQFSDGARKVHPRAAGAGRSGSRSVTSTSAEGNQS